MFEAILIAILTGVAIVELGLTAHLVNVYNIYGYPSYRYRSLLVFLLFNACWTTVFGFAYICFLAASDVDRVASMAACAVWLFITAMLWVIAAGLFTDPLRNGLGGFLCWNVPIFDLCRKTQTAEGLAWTAFSLCVLTIIVCCFRMRPSRDSAPPTTTSTTSTTKEHHPTA